MIRNIIAPILLVALGYVLMFAAGLYRLRANPEAQAVLVGAFIGALCAGTVFSVILLCVYAEFAMRARLGEWK